MSKLSVHAMQGGERVPMLHDERGLPLFYPSLFATSQLRNAGVAVSTIGNTLADLIVLLRWEQAHQRELLSEFRNECFPSLADVVCLRVFAKLDMREWSAGDRGEVRRIFSILPTIRNRRSPDETRHVHCHPCSCRHCDGRLQRRAARPERQ